MGEHQSDNLRIKDFKGRFEIELIRYSDPERLNLARNAAIYLGKPDLDNTRRPVSIIKAGHVPEIFRGEYAEFIFHGVSKEVYDHLTSYTTRNMRVAGGNRALVSDEFTMPTDKMTTPGLVYNMIQASMENYHYLLSQGETPQVARSAMPIGAQLNPFVLQFNFLTLMQAVFSQRLGDPGTQGNTRRVVEAMFELVHQVDPELWDAAYHYYGPGLSEWKTARRKLEKMSARDLIGRLMSIGKPHLDDLDVDKLTAEEALRMLFGQSKSMWS